MATHTVPQELWEDLLDVLECYQFSYDDEGAEYNREDVQQVMKQLKELPDD